VLVTLALPAFDEAPNIEAVVRDAISALDAARVDGELLLVDDGSTDGTGALMDAIATRERRVRVVHHATNRGFTGAMTTALRESRGEWVFLAPADGQVDMRELTRFLAARPDADIVVGIRSHRVERIGRVLLSRAFHGIAKTLFPLPLAEFSSVFLFRRSLIDAMPLRSRPRSATFLPEVLYRANARHARFVQLVIEPRARMGGRAKGAQLSVALYTLVELMRLAPLVRWDEFTARGPVRSAVRMPRR
jgi:glycosyltransferase involved in cell wall biosynthesis